MAMQVRMANFEDIDALVAVRFDYFAVEKWEISAEKYTVIESNLRLYYKKNLNVNFFAAIIEVDGKIVSAAFLAIAEKPASLSFPTGKTGIILNVLTYPEHRRLGYSTLIMNALIDKARAQGLSYIELSASESGKSLYKKLGFQEVTSSHFTEMKLSLM